MRAGQGWPDELPHAYSPPMIESPDLSRDTGPPVPAPEAGAPESIAATSLEKPAGRRYHPSPEDWRAEIFYSIVTDRFQATEPIAAEGDLADGTSRHGGDLRGLTSRLGYIRDLGATTVQLSPVALNGSGAYHGYAPRHFMAVDPRLGTLAELRRTVDTAHRLGLRVVLDLVLNHAGPVFDYADGSNAWKGTREAADVAANGIAILPLELASPRHFSRRGVIDDWDDTDQETQGDFPPDYRRLATENPRTRELLQYIACWWIKETDIDGVRLDAIRHMDRTFIRDLSSAVKDYARSLGKTNFAVIGEHASSDNTLIASCFESGVSAMYNYGEYRRQNRALHGRGPARLLEHSFENAAKAFGGDHGSTVRFIDNHDVYRFLRDGEPLERLRVALAFLLFSLGIPMLYYGTERGFRQASGSLDPENLADPADPGNREDMFPEGKFVSASSSGDGFDRSSPVFGWTRRLIEIRRRYAALRFGEQEVVFSDPSGPGNYAFVRRHGEGSALVVLNTADRARRLDLSAGVEPGGPLVDVLDPSAPAQVGGPGDGPLSMTVPPFGVSVLVQDPGHRKLRPEAK
ncbi:Glycosidase [Actinomadura mexicana]|uniref:Alpha-amylase n=2 Tax=Actinomadura mexicana TaxID=134959 RepID=A0A238ZEC1_9ACTN|nr:Glycosidase [Actinomadura mexicana]